MPEGERVVDREDESRGGSAHVGRSDIEEWEIDIQNTDEKIMMKWKVVAED